MHDYYRLPNACQSKAERKLKYAIARMAGQTREESLRLRDWNWSKIMGQLAIAMSQAGKSQDDKQAVRDLCEIGYAIFLNDAKKWRREHEQATKTSRS